MTLQGAGELMWTLLRKNFWMWRPPRSINIYIFALAFGFSLADWFGHFSAGAWVFPCCLTLLIAQAGGIGAMDVDLKRDNILFLEYLPVRWWQVWLANWLDQLFACLLIVPLLCWHRVLTWTPPDAGGSMQHFRSEAGIGIFQSRWLLPAGLAAGVFFAYSYALLWRTFVKSEKAALIPTWLGSLIYIMLPLGIPALLMVAPGLWDLWPLLIFQGCIFSICSLIVFAIPPRHWSRKRRFAIVGLPLLLAAWMIELSAAWYVCKRTETLNWAEPEMSYSVRPSTAGDTRWLSVDVDSNRSGTHQFLLDTQYGGSIYVGRNLRFIAADSTRPGEPLVALPIHRPIAWSPLRNPVFSILPDGSQKTTLFEDGFVRDEMGDAFEVRDAQWIGDGKTLVVLGVSSRAQHRGIFVIDQSGRTLKRFDASYDYAPFLTDGATRVLMTVSGDMQQRSTPTDHALYRLYDVASDTESTFELPDRALCFSSDLSQAVCIRTRLADGTIHGSILSVDLTTRASRVLVAEGVLPPIPAGEYAARERYHDSLPHPARFPDRSTREEPLMVFDRAFHHAVLVVDRYEGAAAYMSLVDVDLSTGRGRTIVPEAQLGARGVSSPRQDFDLYGITPDGATCVYRNGATLVRVTIADGHADVTTIPADTGISDLSPSARRALVYSTSRRSDTPMQSWQILDLPGSSLRCTVADAISVQWFDDDQLIVTRAQGVSLFSIAGGVERQLLPPPNGASHP